MTIKQSVGILLPRQSLLPNGFCIMTKM